MLIASQFFDIILFDITIQIILILTHSSGSGLEEDNSIRSRNESTGV